MNSIIAIASGKGGVGKSTVAANLAVALANGKFPGASGPNRVALIDLDFYGPSIPTLMGGGEVQADHEGKLIPAQKFGVKYVSVAFFLKNPDDAVIWRGPMFGKAQQQLFNDVAWGDIDVCVIDMPPGTGDAQLSLAQQVSLDGAIMVTTPQEVALSDVRRAVNMFRKVNVPVLGVVENMAGFVAPDGTRIDIFGKGGGEALSKQYEIPFLGSLPLDMAVREGGDKGEPVALKLDTAVGKLYQDLAQGVMAQVAAAKLKQPELKVVN